MSHRHPSAGTLSFFRARRGSLVVWAAFLMVPMLGFVGLGVDSARSYMVRARLSQALDSAALAAGKHASDQDKAREEAMMVFKANFPAGYMDATVTGPTFTFNEASDTVTVAGAAVLPTYFVHLIGSPTVTVGASSEVTRRTVYMDVVVSIDVSGSMDEYIAGTKKIDAATTATRTLVDVLFGASDTKELLKMGLVTWNSNARILDINSTYKRNQAKSKSVASYKDPTTSNTSRNKLWFAKDSPVPLFTRPANGWKGCVHARYLHDGDSSNDADLLVSTGTVGGKAWIGWKPAFDSNTSGDEMQCPSQGIKRLTNIRGQMISAIQQVTDPSGNTNLAVGLVWGWSLLGINGSPFMGDGTTPPAAGEGELIRAIVIMTDGANTKHNDDAYEGRLSASQIDDRTETVAKRIKDEGVVIYGIQFGYKSGPQEALMRKVASGPSAPYYQYAPDAASLKAAFQEIGNHLSKLRLSR